MEFGTSGARGIYGKEMTPEFVYRVVRNFAEGEVAVAMDTRPSSPSLYYSALSAVLTKGKAIVLDYAPTPVLAFYSKGRKGVMITASHNPIEYNGVKLFEDGLELSKERADQFLEGDGGEYTEGKVLLDSGEDYIKKILSLSPRLKGEVVVDCNGVTSYYTPKILTALGAKVISVNCSGRMLRPSEPNEKNLHHLSAFDGLFIAHDGDGDRVMAGVRGKLFPGDVLLAMIIEEKLKERKGKIVTTVEASLLIREIVEKNGGELIITPVGSTYVGEAIREHDALFGGEPAGEFIFPEISLTPDGIYGGIMLTYLHEKEDLERRISRYSSYPILRGKVKVKEKEETMEKIKEEIDVDGKRLEIDGIRVDGEDFWFLIRPSGTEQVIRITVEAKEKEKAEGLYKKLENLVRRFSE